MGKNDIKMKKYVSRPEVFADLFNFLLFDGEEKILSSSLHTQDPVETLLPFARSGENVPVQKYRDILMETVIMEDDHFSYALMLGVENQTHIHYAMPVRNMVYDSLNYAAQVDKKTRENRIAGGRLTDHEFLSGFRKDDRLKPVITLVLYMGKDKWDGPFRLHDMIGDEYRNLLKYAADYKINLLSPVSLEDDDIRAFRTDFKEVASFLRYSDDKAGLIRLLREDENFKHLDRLTAEIIRDITNLNPHIQFDEKGGCNKLVNI